MELRVRFEKLLTGYTLVGMAVREGAAVEIKDGIVMFSGLSERLRDKILKNAVEV